MSLAPARARARAHNRNAENGAPGGRALPTLTTMIARIWHGWTKRADAEAYEKMLRNEILGSGSV